MNFGKLGIKFGSMGRVGAVTVVPFTPASLYAGGETGDYWDPSDLTKMFQNSNGTTAVAVANDPVGYMGGQRGVYNFTQATAGLRPLYKGSGATGNLFFDDTDDVFIVGIPGGAGQTQAASKFMHDGTGGSLWTIGQASAGEDKNFIGTKNTATAAGTHGCILQRLNSNNRPQFLVSNNVTNVIALSPSSGAQWPADTLAMLLVTYSTADGAKMYVNGVQVATATEGATPSTSNAQIGFTLGPTTVRQPHDIRASGFINRVLTATEALNMYNYYHALGAV